MSRRSGKGFGGGAWQKGCGWRAGQTDGLLIVTLLLTHPKNYFFFGVAGPKAPQGDASSNASAHSALVCRHGRGQPQHNEIAPRSRRRFRRSPAPARCSPHGNAGTAAQCAARICARAPMPTARPHRPRQELEFIIHADGRVEERVRGVKGANCQEITAKIESALGEVRRPSQRPMIARFLQPCAEPLPSATTRPASCRCTILRLPRRCTRLRCKTPTRTQTPLSGGAAAAARATVAVAAAAGAAAAVGEPAGYSCGAQKADEAWPLPRPQSTSLRCVFSSSPQRAACERRASLRAR